MAIVRSTMIDDDGSGTTGTILNNAWLQDIYTRIDAAPPMTAWTPVDASGAGLTIGVTSAFYTQIGKLIAVTLNATIPSNANAAILKIGGLPFPCFGTSGLYVTYGAVARTFHISSGTSEILAFDMAGNGLSNAGLSGAAVVLSGVYFST